MNVNYDFFERQHKQDGGTADQQRHYELGWEACDWVYKHDPRGKLLRDLQDLLEDIDAWLPGELPVRIRKCIKELEIFNENP